jgi:two-component system OmpR family sensor kinase
MKLRTRLIIAFTALLLLVIAVVGAIAVRSTRRVLITQIDQRVTTVMAQNARFDPGRQPPGPGGDRFLAEMLVAEDGTIISAAPSGIEGETDPLPDVSDLPELGSRRAMIVTLPSSDGEFSYRAGIAQTRNGLTVIFAHPMRDVTGATDALTRRLLLAGAVVLVIGGGAVWWTVRQGLRPVDDMITTASAIADGDFTRRIPQADPASELGRLGTALNHMLANIETAFAAESLANDRLKQFVADASHELRTPIAAIGGYAELHRKGAFSDPADSQHAIRRIEAETKRMKRMVDDLLLLARLDLDQQLEHRSVDVTALASDVVTDSMAIDPERPMMLEGASPVIVNGDGERITQIMANLLANVRAHTPTGTGAVIKVEQQNGHAVIEVTDSGPGFLPESLGHIFDRFYRADVSRSRKSGGSGLGLAIVAAIARAHGGNAEATNDAGGGARITVRLPAVRSA